MAATAMRAKERVHPFVEPMYGARRVSEAASQPVEAVTERVGETPARPEPLVTREKSAASAGFIHLSRDGEAAMNGAPEVSEPARQSRSEVPARERFEALLPEVVSESSLLHPTLRDTAATDGTPRPQRWDRRREGDAAEEEWKFKPLMGETSGAGGRGVGNKPVVDFEERSDSAHNEPRAPAVLRPTLRETSVNDGGLGASGLRSAAEVVAGRRLAQQQARKRAEQQGDEIQIHIGRIEVIAMPPAPRPMPVPVRKTQTLDEYLRRSSGRAG
jgi:hypothetical protein